MNPVQDLHAVLHPGHSDRLDQVDQVGTVVDLVAADAIVVAYRGRVLLAADVIDEVVAGLLARQGAE